MMKISAQAANDIRLRLQRLAGMAAKKVKPLVDPKDNDITRRLKALRDLDK